MHFLLVLFSVFKAILSLRNILVIFYKLSHSFTENNHANILNGC